jgi:uncharacterized protein
MALLEKKVKVKRSQLPGSGKGLFATIAISRGTRIVEYKGKITTWKEVEHDEGKNGYIYYVKRNHVIDAGNTKTALARYANDARGISRVKGISNNAEYIEEGLKVYIKATKNIPAGAEILVDYGKEYWDAIRYNIKLEAKEKKLREN